MSVLLRHFARRVALSGTMAALTSGAMLAARGVREEGSAAGPLNGPSQWLWGEREARTTRATLRHTLTGYLIHHASAMLWAGLYEAISAGKPRQGPARVLAKAAGVTAVAFAVDYGLTPRRFQPGFEKHLRPSSIAAVYTCFACGLALATLMRRGR